MRYSIPAPSMDMRNWDKEVIFPLKKNFLRKGDKMSSLMRMDDG